MTYCTGFQQSWALKGLPASAGEARKLLRDALADPIYADQLDDAQLAVTEIVTNVVLHTDSDLVMTLRAEHGRVCVQIRDDSPVMPIERNHDAEATTGRGISLVRQVTSAYGAEALTCGSKIVWFVIGPVQVPDSPWPFLDESVDHPPTATVPTQQGNAVQVLLPGAEPASWIAMVEEGNALFREVKLFQKEHPYEGITGSELALAELARSKALATIEAALSTSIEEVPGSFAIRLWVTPTEAEHFGVLGQVLHKAERLALSRRLLKEPSLPPNVALREWAIGQIISQFAGSPVEPWDDGTLHRDSAAAAPTIDGWDKSYVDTATQHVVAVDATNRIVAISSPLAALLGWRTEDLVGRRVGALIPPHLREAHLASFKAYLTTGVSTVLGRELTMPLLHADGRELPCLMTITQVGTRVGHPVFSATITPAAASAGEEVDDPQRGRPTGPGADLSSFTLGDMARMAAGMRHLGEAASSVESFANSICRYLYDQFRDEAGGRQTVLVRFYATLPLADLPDDEQSLAQGLFAGSLGADTTCITLLATAGDRPSWNDRTASRNSRVIPLTDPQQFAGLPVMTTVMEQLGIDPSVVLSRRNNFDLAVLRERYGIFHVADNGIGPEHPSHGFYQKHRIQSMIGFGGALPTGGLFGVMVLSRTPVTPEAAQMFEILAHSTTFGCFAKSGVPVFDDGLRTDRPGQSLSACQRIATQKDILTRLLEAHERVTADESDALTQALERAHFETQRYAALARTLQSTLLPPELPVIPGLQTGAYFRPAGDGSEIGGDFYDLFPIADNRFGFVLGDVSGKGAEAAALTALARHTVRAAAVAAADSCQVLRRLDQSVSAKATDGRYLTALFAFVTTAPGVITLRLALGGHPQPFVLRADGSIEAVGVEGGALGLFPDPSLTDIELQLRPGDTFVAYSDGVTEARRGDEQFGGMRLSQLLIDQHGQEAADIALHIGTQVLDFQHGNAHDDTAVVVLRCL